MRAFLLYVPRFFAHTTFFGTHEGGCLFCGRGSPILAENRTYFSILKGHAKGATEATIISRPPSDTSPILASSHALAALVGKWLSLPSLQSSPGLLPALPVTVVVWPTIIHVSWPSMMPAQLTDEQVDAPAQSCPLRHGCVASRALQLLPL